MIMVRTILTVIQVITALVIICVIMLQSGKNAGLSGAIAGAADSFLSKSKASTWDARLARSTKWIAIVFLVLTLVLSLIPTAAA
jgi:preprotein translocase subunit SecG